MNPWEMYGGQTQEPNDNPWEQFTPPQTVKQKEGIGRTAFDQGLQGATFGFADEATDALGTLLATAARKLSGPSLSAGPSLSLPADVQAGFNPSLGDTYKEARGLTTERQQRQFEDRPVVSIASNIAGGLLTGGAGATTKAGAATGNFIRTGNLAARSGKGAVAGAASGAVYGAGTAEDGNRLSGAGQGAILGGVAGASLPAIGSALSKANTRVKIPGSDQIKAKASDLYKAAENHGGEFKPEFTNQFLARAQKVLLSDDALINAMKSNKPLADAFDDLVAFKDQPMTLSRAQALDEQLGNMIDGFVDAQGNTLKVGKKILDVQRNLRNMIETAEDGLINGSREGFDALKEGRKLWATSRRLADIERILENAETYQVPATAIKTGFRRLKNSAKILGYSPEEVKAISKAANTGMLTDLLATFGSRLGPIIGLTSGVGGGALSYGASTAARAGATASQISRAENVARLVANRSGMVKTQQRIPIGQMRELLKLPPSEARLLLEKLNQN